MFLGRLGVVAGDRDRAENLLYFTIGVRVAVQCRMRECALTECAGGLEVAAAQPEIGEVDFDHRGRVRITD